MNDVRRRPGGRSALVRDAVRRACFELLEEVGYERLQLTDVAARAGVNKTTVYRRWPTKVELLAEFFADLAAAEAPMPDTGTLRGDLLALLREVSDLLDQAPVKAILRASLTLADDDEAAQAARSAFWDHRFGRSAALVERAVARGELADTTVPRPFLEAVFAPLYFRKLILGLPVTDDYLEGLATRA